MYYIVGDIGNTSTRICLLNKFSNNLKSLFLIQKIFLQKDIQIKPLRKLLKKNKKKILFSCVVPLAFKKLKKT